MKSKDPTAAAVASEAEGNSHDASTFTLNWSSNLVRSHLLQLLRILPTKLRFESRKLSLDVLHRFALADDLLPITAQEVVDRFDADAN